jgi:hypothetical protein
MFSFLQKWDLFSFAAAAVGIFALRHSTCRDFEKIGERMLNPVVEALQPIAEINIESQVLICIKLSYLLPFLMKIMIFLFFNIVDFNK